MSKSDQTRARFLEAALDLFRRHGFEKTTMREIAVEAGMATGAAYYYFDSKDAIVLAFYDQAQREMEPLLEEVLASESDPEQRLRRLIEVKFKYFEPSRRLLGALSSHTDPEHPLSPFSSESKIIRERDMGYFGRAISGSKMKFPDDLAPHLPGILWMYQMGMILFWIYDRSEGQKRTRRLVDKSLHVIVRLIKISTLPLMRPLRRVVVELAEIVAQSPAELSSAFSNPEMSLKVRNSSNAE